MSFEVNVKPVAPQQVLSITHHIKINKLEEAIRTSLDTMFAILKDQGIEAASAPFGIFHGAINEQEDGPLEICMPVNGQVTGKGNVQVAYKGRPLYRAATDLKSGDMTGTSVSGFTAALP